MAGKNVSIQIVGDGESAKAALEMVRTQLAETAAEAKSKGGEISEAMEMVTRALERIGIYIGIRETVEMMKEMVKGSVELGMEIGHLAKETGITSENLSVLKYASDITGVSFEALTKGSVKLSKAMLDAEEGKKQAINSFARLGISQADVISKSHDLYGMLELVADRFQKIPDGPQKAAAAVGLFGKAGAALIPFLDQGAAGIEELRGQAESLGLVLNEEGVQKMEKLHEESVRLKGGFEGAALAITSGLAPALLQLGSAMNGAKGEMSDFEAVGEFLGGTLKVLVTIWDWALIQAEQTEELLWDGGKAVLAFGAAVADVAKGDIVGAQAAWAAMRADSTLTSKVLGDNAANFKRQMEALWGDHKLMDKLPARHTGDDVHVGDQTGTKEKSLDGVDKADASLAEARATAMADATKAANARILAELEAGHKQFIVSDRDFYQIKAILMQEDIDVEIDALRKRNATLAGLKATQHADKTLKERDKNGESAPELATDKQIVELNQKINDLVEKRAIIDTQYKAGNEERATAQKLAAAKMAAELEAETNQTITARIALLRLEADTERLKVAAAGGKGSTEYNQIGQLEALKEAKLQIGEVNRQITDTEQDYKRAVEQLNDAASKDPRLKKAATAEINQLNKEEAAQLKALVADYDALAQVLGGEYIQKARDLHAELDKLNTPSQKGEADFGKTLAEGVESMSRRIADATLSGKMSFRKMAQDIERDLLNLALKLAEEKWLTPLITGAVNGKAQLPNVGNVGGGSAAKSAIPDPATLAQVLLPKVAGGSGGGIFDKLTGASGSSGIQVKIVMENNTGQPINASQGSGSFDAEAKSFVINTVLENASSGGIMGQLFGAFGK